MEVMCDQLEFFANVERSARKRSVLRQMMDAIEKHGPLLPQGMMAAALDLSTQRVSQLIAEDKLATIEVAGKNFIPVASLELYLTEEKRAGRPVDPGSRWSIYKRIRAGQKASRK
jgi:hypothetical protein